MIFYFSRHLVKSSGNPFLASSRYDEIWLQDVLSRSEKRPELVPSFSCDAAQVEGCLDNGMESFLPLTPEAEIRAV